jgi:hypothetical protein
MDVRFTIALVVELSGVEVAMLIDMSLLTKATLCVVDDDLDPVHLS